MDRRSQINYHPLSWHNLFPTTWGHMQLLPRYLFADDFFNCNDNVHLYRLTNFTSVGHVVRAVAICKYSSGVFVAGGRTTEEWQNVFQNRFKCSVQLLLNLKIAYVPLL